MPAAVEGPLPSLSVVVPTARGGADLEACLESLVAERYPTLEAVVVDDGSPAPLTRLAARFPDVRVLRSETGLGFVGACTRGVAETSGELVLLLNDDTLLEPGSLHALVDALVRRPSWGACQAKLLLLDDPTLLDTAGSFLTATGFLLHRGASESETRYQSSDEVFAAKGAALLVRRRAFEEVGGLDPAYFAYFEETDLCWRLWLAGWEVGFAAEARIRHRLGSTASALPPELVQFHSFKNRIRTLAKNLGPGRLAWMLPLHLALCLGLAVWWALHGRRPVAWSIPRAMGWNVAHLPGTLALRAYVQESRRVTDRELMPRICRRVSFRTLAAYARTTPPAARSEAGIG